jgi:radical SAM protein with 4Fe4S-binding SPASM domain
LNWVYDKQAELGMGMFLKPTDAPHYMRVVRQRERKDTARLVSASEEGKASARQHPAGAITRGCLAGVGFCFISHRGGVQGCGYLSVEASNVRTEPFGRIWNDSPLFRELRDLSRIKGKCGVCEYKRVCGGCRARAYEATGDYLGPEPYCVYEPVALRALAAIIESKGARLGDGTG